MPNAGLNLRGDIPVNALRIPNPDLKAPLHLCSAALESKIRIHPKPLTVRCAELPLGVV